MSKLGAQIQSFRCPESWKQFYSCRPEVACNIALVIQTVAELFYDGIRQEFPGDPFHLSLGGGLVQPAIERELKELALADPANALLAALAQNAMNALTLTIQALVL